MGVNQSLLRKTVWMSPTDVIVMKRSHIQSSYRVILFTPLFKKQGIKAMPLNVVITVS